MCNYKIIKRSMYQKYTIIKICAPNNRALKCMKQKL